MKVIGMWMLLLCLLTGHVFGEYFSEDWAIDPYNSGWIGNLGLTNHTCFEWDTGGYVYESESYPAVGSGYFYGMYFNDSEVTAELQLGTHSYDLAGIVLWENTDNFYHISYDKYRDDFRFMKYQDGTPLCDWSSGQSVIIPSSGNFTLTVARVSNQFDLMIDYQSNQYYWTVIDSLGTSIGNLKLGLCLRYEGAKCFSMSVNGDCTSPEIAVDDIYMSTWPLDQYEFSQWFPTDSLCIGTLISNSSPVVMDSIRLSIEYNGADVYLPDAIGGPINPSDTAWVYSYVEIPEFSTSFFTEYTISADPNDIYAYEDANNNSCSKDYSIYYAEVADSVFCEYPYTYGQFRNSGLEWTVSDVYLAFQRAYPFPFPWNLNYFADLIIALSMRNQAFNHNFGGLCYGMCSASGAYYTGALEKPYPKQVFYYTYEEAKPDILYCHILQGTELVELLWGMQSGYAASNQIRSIIGDNGIPAIFGLKVGNSKHAVLAYRVIETEEHMYVYCYEPNMLIPWTHGQRALCYEKASGQWYRMAVSADYLYYDDPQKIDNGFSPVFSFPYFCGISLSEEIIDAVYVCDHFASKDIPSLEELGSSYLDVLMLEYLQDTHHALITDTVAVTGMTDNYGRRSGYISGVFYDEIPDVQYFGSDSMELVIFPDTLDYEVQIANIVNDSLCFDITYNLGSSTVNYANWHKVPTTDSSVSYINIEQMSTDFFLGVDYDGDGIIDEYLSPDYQGEHTTGIEGSESGEPADLELIAFPNPVSGNLSITYGVPESGPIQVSLYDLAGRIAMIIENTHRGVGTYSTTADCSVLPTGVYICTVRQGSHLTRRNLVVLH